MDRAALLRELSGKPQFVERAIDRSAIDVEGRTVSLAFASEQPYRRWWGTEILDMQPSSVDLSRLKNKAALLLNHDADQLIGVVESAAVGRDKKARASVRFSRGALGEEVLQDVADGIREKISVGYMINDMQLEKQEGDLSTFRVTSWTPYELSFVSIPADDSVGIGRSFPNRKGNQMEHQTRTQRRSLEREREQIQFAAIPQEDRAGFRFGALSITGTARSRRAIHRGGARETS